VIKGVMCARQPITELRAMQRCRRASCLRHNSWSGLDCGRTAAGPDFSGVAVS
jgi:hypothetical protein